MIGTGTTTLDNCITDDELEELARDLIEGMNKDDVKELCLALLELYNSLYKPVYH